MFPGCLVLGERAGVVVGLISGGHECFYVNFMVNGYGRFLVVGFSLALSLG